jgi:DnaK suppressor protein
MLPAALPQRQGGRLRRVNAGPWSAREHCRMKTHLTAGQRAQLKELLELRQHELDERLASDLGPKGRVAHAREVLEQDSGDAPQRAADREIDLARSDAELRELGAISQALQRLDSAEFGLCADCGEPIAFDRLRAEPWALRCVACESRREGATLAPRL